MKKVVQRLQSNQDQSLISQFVLILLLYLCNYRTLKLESIYIHSYTSHIIIENVLYSIRALRSLNKRIINSTTTLACNSTCTMHGTSSTTHNSFVTAFPSPNLVHQLHLKLISSNFLLWKIQFLPMVGVVVLIIILKVMR